MRGKIRAGSVKLFGPPASRIHKRPSMIPPVINRSAALLLRNPIDPTKEHAITRSHFQAGTAQVFTSNLCHGSECLSVGWPMNEQYLPVQLAGMYSRSAVMCSTGTAMMSFRGVAAVSAPSELIHPQAAAAGPQETESWFRNKNGWSTTWWRFRSSYLRQHHDCY